MTLDAETLEALGMGDHWEQLAIRWPLYVVSERRVEQKRAAAEQYNRRQGRRARVAFASEADRAAHTTARVKRNRSTPEARARDAARKRTARAA